MKKEKEQKETKLSRKSRFKVWFLIHEDVIICSWIYAIGIATGAIIIGDRAHARGYFKGLKEFRNHHKDVCNTIIDECGHQAAFEALNLVRSNPEMMDKLMKDQDSVISKVGGIYYSNDYIQKLIKSVNE